MLKSFYQDSHIEAGCDEAGRGCLAGPVVAAAVILGKDFDHPLLNDSKQVSEKNRDELRLYIMEHALDWQIGVVEVEEIDRINILKASFLAMHKAVDGLLKKPALLLIDGNRFTPYSGIPHECIIKGDSLFKSIAAASILAKTHRDQIMYNLDPLFPQYQWKKNKGYGTADHRKAIVKEGLCLHHRKSFQCYPVPELFPKQNKERK